MDDNFPTFTGEESPAQQITALHNYLYQMREGLQYSMRNLTADNFNEAAWQQLTDDQKNSVAKELQKLRNMITQFSNEIDSLKARVGSVENLGNRMNEAETAITYLEEDAAQKDVALKGYEESIAGLEKAVTELQDGQAALEGQMGTAQGDIDALRIDVDTLTESVSGEGGLKEQMQGMQVELEKVSGIVRAADDGNATLGGEGKAIYLVGEIYINGKLMESGGGAT